MLCSFKLMLLVERSTSVGRDSVIDPVSAPATWRAIDADAGLARHIAVWNADIVESMNAKVARLSADIVDTLGSREAPGAAEYGAIAPLAAAADKKLAVIRSISSCLGRQVCHADTLVAACLLDDEGELGRYTVRCTAGLEPDAASSLCALLAPAGPEREALASRSLALLEAALGGKRAREEP